MTSHDGPERPTPSVPGASLELLDAYVPDLQDQLQHVDPPLHTRHRSIVSRWFTPNAVERRADAIRDIATSLIDRFADGGRVEILDALAGPLPATVVADIIGIPEDRRDVFLDWKEEVIGNPEVEFTSATSERYQRIRQLFLTFIAARRAEPGDDMISTLVTARTRDGDVLDDQAVLGLLLLFLGGGQETTGKAITSGVRVLATQPELQSELRARAGPHSRLHRGAAALRVTGQGHLPRRHPRDADRRSDGPRRVVRPADVGVGQPRRGSLRRARRVRCRSLR